MRSTKKRQRIQQQQKLQKYIFNFKIYLISILIENEYAYLLFIYYSQRHNILHSFYFFFFFVLVVLKFIIYCMQMNFIFQKIVFLVYLLFNIIYMFCIYNNTMYINISIWLCVSVCCMHAIIVTHRAQCEHLTLLISIKEIQNLRDRQFNAVLISYHSEWLNGWMVGYRLLEVV